jgi:hypothetical protein
MQAAASRFLGRFWAGSHKSLTLNAPNSGASRPDSTIRRSPSKQSMASTLNSMESAVSDASTAATEMSTLNDQQKTRAKSTLSHKDKDLHGQIEDLLMALNDLQREQADLARELQQEREEREEDHEVSKAMLTYIKDLENREGSQELITKAEERLSTTTKRMSIVQTKHQLRDEVTRWKEKHEVEAARCVDLGRRLDDHESENSRMKEELRESRSRIQDGHREKQKLERTIQELRTRKPSPAAAPQESLASASDDVWPASGLREFKLVGRTSSQKTKFPKRTSSLGLPTALAAENTTPSPSGSEESLLLELVNAKTAEAVAKQELEEVKAKLDSLRRLMSGSHTPRASPSIESSNPLSISLPGNSGTHAKLSPDTSKSTPSSGGGFFGWGKRSLSTVSLSESK